MPWHTVTIGCGTVPLIYFDRVRKRCTSYVGIDVIGVSGPSGLREGQQLCFTQELPRCTISRAGCDKNKIILMVFALATQVAHTCCKSKNRVPNVIFHTIERLGGRRGRPAGFFRKFC